MSKLTGTTIICLIICLAALAGCSYISTPSVTAGSLFKDHGLEGGRLKHNASTGDLVIELQGYQSTAKLDLIREIVNAK